MEYLPLTSAALIQWAANATIAFIVAFALTPLWTAVLYRYRLGKKVRNTGATPIFSLLHKSKEGTPTMGGVIIWATTALLFFVFSYFDSTNIASRAQTILPMGFLLMAAGVGLIDDLFNIFGRGPNSGGLRMRHRFIAYTFIAVIGAIWFWSKLEWSSIYVPFTGFVDIGFWFVPVFVLIIIATGFSVNEIDGLDGLAGGTLLVSFLVLSTVALFEGKFALSAFLALIVGSLLAFLWFNIHPARFFMGDTGAMSLGVMLGVVAILTHTELYLPVFGLLFVFESLSVIFQIIWRKLFGRKLLKSAPLHHHFEAIGWGEPKIVMRFWVVSGVAGVAAVLLILLDPSFPLLGR
ncbi:phospho-N-acetylmuramoyl-pentapeptide-transferase [Candidatus Uhrbacteria bacterium]|nr:phospho-N-acetylmuramoyl-pentapeptide-transferase [Candidatus Uhrbacteria bacterium]